MDKFTKLQKGIKKENKNEPKIKYDGYLKVIEYKDYEFVDEKDMVIILPYLRDESQIILRHEYVPTYQYHYRNSNDYKSITNFLTVISGSVEVGETLKNAVRRELYEEAGIVLSSMYDIDIEKSLFISKGNCGQYHICLLEMRYNDFKVTRPPGDGSVSESLSRSIKISLGDIDEVRTHDLITDYMLNLFKLKYMSKK